MKILYLSIITMFFISCEKSDKPGNSGTNQIEFCECRVITESNLRDLEWRCMGLANNYPHFQIVTESRSMLPCTRNNQTETLREHWRCGLRAEERLRYECKK